MPDDQLCALPKSESAYLDGVHMKNANSPTLREEVERYKRELKDVSSPNAGRIQELRDKIKKKMLLTKEAIEEAAERLAELFFRRG